MTWIPGAIFGAALTLMLRGIEDAFGVSFPWWMFIATVIAGGILLGAIIEGHTR